MAQDIEFHDVPLDILHFITVLCEYLWWLSWRHAPRDRCGPLELAFLWRPLRGEDCLTSCMGVMLWQIAITVGACTR